MKKRILLFAVILSLALCGCSLAREDGLSSQGQDTLVGVFITEEHLDLFDMEAYFKDHASELLEGGDIATGDSDAYNRRIYADMGNGCQFDLEGIPFICYAYERPNETGRAMAPGDKISDGHVDLQETQTGITLDMEGTIFISDKIGEACFFLNPVYQDPEGNVYLTAGTGLSSMVTEGMESSMSQTVSGAYTYTSGDVTMEYSSQIVIHVDTIVLPESYNLVFVDADRQVISRETYTPEHMPEKIQPPENTAYLLVESCSRKRSGEPQVLRKLYSPEGESVPVEIYLSLDDPICTKKTIEIIW